MICNALKLVQFKNYSESEFNFHDHLNIIFGLNGMGKTNILDALHYLCMVKSNFNNRDQSAIMLDRKFLRLEGKFSRRDQKYDVSLTYSADQGKEIKLNKKVHERLSDHIGLIPVVFSAPKDIQLLTGASSDRRSLLDRVLSQLDMEYLHNLGVYKNLLKHRNALLKSWQAGKIKREMELLDSYTERMAGPAKYLFEARLKFIDDINTAVSKRYAQISKAREKVRCAYKTELSAYNFSVLMDKNKSYDMASGRTNAGIHKDDLVFYLDDIPAKEMASQGQLKSLILAIKFALYDVLYKEKKDKPILLLDDIFAKLDRERILELIQLILDEDMGQVFITDTDVKRLDEIMFQVNRSYRKFEIENGRIRTIEDMEA